MKGSEKQAEWAEKIKSQRLSEIKNTIKEGLSKSSIDRYKKAQDILRELQSAKWWIETRMATTGRLVLRVRDGKLDEYAFGNLIAKAE